MDLLKKYAPRTLTDVAGQPDVTRALALFARDPHSAAFLFHGESGIGKTCCARALARDLGVAVDDDWLGGLYEIASGEQTADSTRAMLERLAYRPLTGSGWKVLVCNECDRMTQGAETIWLDALEHLPPRTVVVFTTNEPGRLSQRFRDRCEAFAFESDTARIAPAIRRLAKRVWKAEGCTGAVPGLATLGMPTLCGPDSMHASIRLALQQLAKLVREVKAGASAVEVARVRRQIARSLALDEDTTVECDCGHEQAVVQGSKSVKCRACGKRINVEWETPAGKKGA